MMPKRGTHLWSERKNREMFLQRGARRTRSRYKFKTCGIITSLIILILQLTFYKTCLSLNRGPSCEAFEIVLSVIVCKSFGLSPFFKWGYSESIKAFRSEKNIRRILRYKQFSWNPEIINSSTSSSIYHNRRTWGSLFLGSIHVK